MGDAPRGEQGEETQPLFRGGPGAIPTTRVSNDDTRDLTETPGWAIPEGQGSPDPLPKEEGCIRRTAWGAQSPPGRAGSGWCQAGREKTVPRGCWSERYTPPPRAKPGFYWLLRDTGTPLPPAPWWAGIPRLGQCQCPPLTLAPIPEQRGGGRLREVSWWTGWEEGLWDQRPGSGRGVKGEGKPGPERPLPASDPILPPLDYCWPPSRPLFLSAGMWRYF